MNLKDLSFTFLDQQALMPLKKVNNKDSIVPKQDNMVKKTPKSFDKSDNYIGDYVRGFFVRKPTKPTSRPLNWRPTEFWREQPTIRIALREEWEQKLKEALDTLPPPHPTAAPAPLCGVCENLSVNAQSRKSAKKRPRMGLGSLGARASARTAPPVGAVPETDCRSWRTEVGSERRRPRGWRLQ